MTNKQIFNLVVEEFKHAVFVDEYKSFKEVIQLAAMCFRYIENHAPSTVRLFY